MLVGGHARTVEARRCCAVRLGRTSSRPTARRCAGGAPRVARRRRRPTRAGARPGAPAPPGCRRSAHEAVRDGAGAAGPVLVQVPRRGYLPALACDTCRAPARCPVLHRTAAAARRARRPPACRWCGDRRPRLDLPASAARTACAPPSSAARRTAEELGPRVPAVPVRSLGRRPGARTRRATSPRSWSPRPGAEPVADGGYAAAVLLDTWLLLGRARPAGRGGDAAPVVRRRGAGPARPATAAAWSRSATPRHPAVQALVRWDPAGFAERELAERASAHLPPAVAAGHRDGPPDDLRAAARRAGAAAPAPSCSGRCLADGRSSGQPAGGVAEPLERVVLRVPRVDGAALSRALVEMQGVPRQPASCPPVRVQVDPLSLE